MSFLVTIEGIEGAGKSTLRSRLSDFLTSLGKEVVITREPGATALGQSIRNLVLDPKTKKMSSLAELMLFSADRAQHLEEVVRPALARGALVICDRYIHSTIAYQGYGRGLHLQSLFELNELVTENLKPNLVLLLDLPPEVGLERAASRARRSSGTFHPQEMLAGTNHEANNPQATWTRFEEQDLDFHRRVRKGFLELAKDPANNFVLLDATKNPDALATEATAAIQRLLASAHS